MDDFWTNANLTDQSRARYDCIEFDGKSALRNDGSSIRDIEADPFYVLATLYGEQTDFIDEELHVKNRRVWNGWSCQHLDPILRQNVADQLGLNSEELVPWSHKEEAEIRQLFEERLGSTAILPDHGKFVKWRNSWFTRTFCCDGFYFRGVDFNQCNFDGHIFFRKAFFGQRAKFTACRFERELDFCNSFHKNSFTIAGSWFAKSSWASFEDSVFDQELFFETNMIMSGVGFDRATINGRACFLKTKFLHTVPSFISTVLAADLSLTADKNFWPVPNKTYAPLDKRSYTRLRQLVGNFQLQEDEYFFYRREMACSALIGGWLDNLIVTAFGALSDFGYSVAKPIAALFAAWLCGALIYLYHFSMASPENLPIVTVATPFGLSFGSLFPFLGINASNYTELLRGFPSYISFFVGFQTLVGFVLLFLLGLGLRNRFRLK